MKRLLVALLASVCLSTTALCAEIDVVPHHRDAIWFHGDIEHGDAAKLQRVLDYRNSLGFETNWVVLASDGGYIAKSFRIGRIIHFNRIKTVIGDNEYCASACFTLWAAGSERWYWEHSMIGVHNADNGLATYGGQPGDDPATTAEVARFYNDIGVPAPSSRKWW